MASKDDKSGVYVRATTPSGRWRTVPAEDLDERSFRILMLKAMAKAGLFVAIVDERDAKTELHTDKEDPDEQPAD